MEQHVKKAKFQFNGYRIEKSFIELKENNPNDTFSIKFDPQGVIYQSESRFQLTLNINIENENKTAIIEVSAVADFIYENIEPDKFDAYLFLNGPALLFPYIRAYISTLTTLSGIKSVTLPTLNLVSLRKQLKDNTKKAE